MLLAASAFGPRLAAAQAATSLAPMEHATPAARTLVRIAAGTTYSGTLVINNDSVTICNNGTLAGTIVVSSGVKGTVINNAGSVTSQTIYLNAPTTINNGSDGTAVVPTASWTGYIGDTFNEAPTINNFARFAGEIYTLPGGTIHNKQGAIWEGYIHDCSAALRIINDGTWQSPLTTTGRLHLNNNGLWASRLSANGPATITNLGSWPTQAINSPLTFALRPNGNVSLLSGE